MVRYIAIAWTDPDAQRSEAGQRLLTQVERSLPRMRRVASTPGLLVFSTSATAAEEFRLSSARPTAHSDSIIVLGTLFKRGAHYEEAPEPICSGERIGVVRSTIDHFLANYWGGYVAFSHDALTNKSVVVRDPTGGVACFRVHLPGVTLIFSHVEDCTAIGAISLSINWRQVCGYLIRPQPRARETGLSEVFEVLPGELVDLDGEGKKAPHLRFFWDPMRMSENDAIEDLETAISLANRAVHRAIWAWAACHPRIVHRLSGGLDSAIVLACLVRAPSRPQITCVNDHDESVGGDEREYARLAAKTMLRDTDHEFIEYRCDPADIHLEPLLDIPPLAYPQDFKGMLFARQSAARIARERDAGLFDGSFGDQLFFRPRQYSATDYAWRNGFGRDLPGIALSTAYAGNQTIWRVMRKAFGAAISRGKPGYRAKLPRRSPFLTSHVVDSFSRNAREYLTPPWLTDGVSVPPGKHAHIDQLYTTALTYGGLEQPDDPVKRMPLASQPLIELFLRMPTYVLTAGGQDRAVARRAFEAEIPTEIVRRRSKGVINHFDALVFRRNRALVGDLLLNGVLVREKLLDRQRIEAFLAATDEVRDPYAFMFLMNAHLDQELWLRSWERPTSGATRAAA